MRATQKIFMPKQATRPVEQTKPSEDYIKRSEKIAERNALLWLHRAEIDVDRAKVLRLHQIPLRRYWAKCGYSQSWIDKQFTGILPIDKRYGK